MKQHAAETGFGPVGGGGREEQVRAENAPDHRHGIGVAEEDADGAAETQLISDGGDLRSDVAFARGGAARNAGEREDAPYERCEQERRARCPNGE